MFFFFFLVSRTIHQQEVEELIGGFDIQKAIMTFFIILCQFYLIFFMWFILSSCLWSFFFFSIAYIKKLWTFLLKWRLCCLKLFVRNICESTNFLFVLCLDAHFCFSFARRYSPNVKACKVKSGRLHVLRGICARTRTTMETLLPSDCNNKQKAFPTAESVTPTGWFWEAWFLILIVSLACSRAARGVCAAPASVRTWPVCRGIKLINVTARESDNHIPRLLKRAGEPDQNIPRVN